MYVYLGRYGIMETCGKTNEQERTEKKVKINALIQEPGKRVPRNVYKRTLQCFI